jgi:hypothetical protein
MKSPPLRAVTEALKKIEGACWTVDSTKEALAVNLQESEKGVSLILDELLTLVNGMNQFKPKGNDRQFYLSAWTPSPIRETRKGDYNLTKELQEVRVDHPFLTVIGAITTGQLHRLVSRETEGDGFMDRFLFIHPDGEGPEPAWSKEGVSVASRAAWEAKVKGLQDLAPDLTGVRLSDAADKLWGDLYTRHLKETKTLPEQTQGVWGKFKGYAARLTLILHLLHRDTDCLVIEPDSVEGAWRLVNYFKSHARKVYGVMAEDHMMKQTNRIVKQLRGWCGEHFTESQLHTAVKSTSLFPSPASLTAPLGQLETWGYVWKVEPTTRRGNPGTTYRIHPQIQSGNPEKP